MMRHPTSVSTLYSGSCDGGLLMNFAYKFQKLGFGISLLSISFLSLQFRTTVWNVRAHTGFVRGMTSGSKENTFLSCGDDNVRMNLKLTLDRQIMVDRTSPNNCWT